ncbi:MAG: RpiB/LacA/LacB family sugar-phosphate isomerase [Pyrinomonadaceae bacterium]
MTDDNQTTRDRVRALVRDVLNNALPADETTTVADNAGDVSPSTPETPPSPELPSRDTPTLARQHNIAPTAPAPVAAKDEPSIARDESSKSIITEDDVRGLEEGARLRIAEGARLTALASDIVRERRIELIRRTPRRGSRQTKIIAVGADHGGYKMKEELKTLLTELGHRVLDFGTNSTDAVDYPDFAHSVARAVSDREADLGIVIDGAGIGSAMTANKVPNVRAAACYNIALAKNSREHNDANVLTLGSSLINPAEMRDIVHTWLTTEITEDRHKKRVAKIVAVERKYKCQG